MEHTIAALSTPPGESGIAVIRVSGRDTLALLGGLYRTSGGQAHEGDWVHRRIYHGRIVDRNDEIIDEVIAAVMRAPASYTGEDTVELSCHGGTAVVRRLLERLYEAGARPAEPGEFTRRAFVNGKMDLIQAEAVADLIHARSEIQCQVAQRQLQGALSTAIETMADEVLQLLGVIEANIDFIEDDIDTLDTAGAVAMVDKHAAALDTMLADARFARPFRDGFEVAIVGPVNAGKSSIFNRLAGESRAIVTDIPGTTRDVLREPIVIDGLLYVLMDTAGLRDGSADPVEHIGMGRTGDALRTADVVMFVLDAGTPVAPPEAEAIARLDPSRSLVVANKCDVAAGAPVRDRVHSLESELRVLEVSALTGDGFDDLRRQLAERAGGPKLSVAARERLVLNARLSGTLLEAHQRLSELRTALTAREPLEIMAVKARDVLACFERATGRKYEDGVLDVIFSRFCLGK